MHFHLGKWNVFKNTILTNITLNYNLNEIFVTLNINDICYPKDSNTNYITSFQILILTKHISNKVYYMK